ncbi:MAG: hypothetical protein MI923_03525 [Phycisphaerales bacterium]|nr:hypothetical protein [Phycisphaerales bacterium]
MSISSPSVADVAVSITMCGRPWNMKGLRTSLKACETVACVDCGGQLLSLVR